jgi:non-canonical (house-cleaning) NTP pyrophosphatase
VKSNPAKITAFGEMFGKMVKRASIIASQGYSTPFSRLY